MSRSAIEESKRIAEARQYNMIPVSTEIYADMSTPIEIMKV